jgi:hypothetical protein
VTDTAKTRKLKSDILDEISKRKDYSNIIAWNIQNDVLFNQRTGFHKPELLFQNRAYISWLKDLVRSIKEIDSVRPVIVDLEVNEQSLQNLKMLINNVADIDCIGLVVKDDTNLDGLINYLKKSNTGYIYSEVSTETYTKPEVFDSRTSFFITAWQDQHESDKLTFEGLLDRAGRFKEDFYTLKKRLLDEGPEIRSPKVRILKPSIFIYDNMNVEYTAMVYDEKDGWKYGWKSEGLKFEWALVKCDKYGNYLALREISQGPVINLVIPEEQDLYRLLLTVSDDVTVNFTITRLNTSLKEAAVKNK